MATALAHAPTLSLGSGAALAGPHQEASGHLKLHTPLARSFSLHNEHLTPNLQSLTSSWIVTGSRLLARCTLL